MFSYSTSMKRHLKYVAVFAAVLVVTVAIYMRMGVPSVGVDLPGAVALFETSLQAPISSSATSLTLTSNSVRGGGSLAGYHCFTIDEGSSQAEFVCGTVSGTTVSSLTRGLSPSDGITEVAALQFSHRRGASVKITDFPVIQLLQSQNSGDATFENVLSYAATVVPSGANELADVGYVLSVVNGGTVSFDQLIVAGTAGETVATGTLVYLKASDQEWYKVDADDSTTFKYVPVGLTQGQGSDAVAIGGGGVLLMGRDTTQTGLTAGSDYYASTTAGSFGTTKKGIYLGRAEDATTLYFVPHLDSTVLANTWTDIQIFDESITGHASTSVHVFTSSGTWTKQTGLEYVVVEVQAAGGDGGYAGGASGPYARLKIDAADLSSTETITVGTAGSSTGNTSFGSHVTCPNGNDASGSTPGSVESCTGGDFKVSGQAGGGGYPNDVGGGGGSSVLGRGGYVNPSPNGTTAVQGYSAVGYGGGGGGDVDANDGSPAQDGVGGTGGPGIIIVTEHY